MLSTQHVRPRLTATACLDMALLRLLLVKSKWFLYISEEAEASGNSLCAPNNESQDGRPSARGN